MDTLNLDRPAGVFAAVLTPFDEAGAPDFGGAGAALPLAAPQRLRRSVRARNHRRRQLAVRR